MGQSIKTTAVVEASLAQSNAAPSLFLEAFTVTGMTGIVSLARFVLKIAAKRAFAFFKASPVITVWLVILTAALFIARPAKSLDGGNGLILASLFFCASVILSLRTQDTRRYLVLYAKSKTPNRALRRRFCIYRALSSNAPFLLLDALAVCGIVKTAHPEALAALSAASIMVSFLCALLKDTLDTAAGQRGNHTRWPRPRVGVGIKSACCDYANSGFILSAVCGAAFFAVVLFEKIKDRALLESMEHPSIYFVYLLAALSVVLLGFLDSPSTVNWRFFAVVSAKPFGYHLKRSALFLMSVCCVLVLAFAFETAAFGITRSARYLLTLALVFVFALLNAHVPGSTLLKAVSMILFTAAALWLGETNPWFLPLLAAPVLLAFFRAKSEHKEWYVS